MESQNGTCKVPHLSNIAGIRDVIRDFKVCFDDGAIPHAKEDFPGRGGTGIGVPGDGFNVYVVETGDGSAFTGAEVADAKVEGFAGVCVGEEMVTIYIQEDFMYLFVLAVLFLEFEFCSINIRFEVGGDVPTICSWRVRSIL
jgi:hypothetical protein